MGTVSYGFESMDEVAHQLHIAFGSVDMGQASVAFPAVLTNNTSTAQKRQMSLMTGAQLAIRGRRDMSLRVKDVVLSLALCHNVSVTLGQARPVLTVFVCRSHRYRTTMEL